LAQPIRLLLEYTGTKFEDRMLSCTPAPEFDRSAWTNVKNTLGLDFPNLPYFIDGILVTIFFTYFSQITIKTRHYGLKFTCQEIRLNKKIFVSVGKYKITQSNAILRYIARKHDLLGQTEDERVRVDMMAEQSMDFRNGIVRLSYSPNFVS
jgi:glutathione S-transferase